MTKQKFALFPEEYDEISLVDDGAAGSAHVLIMKRKSAKSPYVNEGRQTTPKPGSKSKRQGRSQSNPCSTSTNSTGAKDGGKSSQRGANWKEERHPRSESGKFGQSSGKSKSQYGKGGTTKSKLDRACRDKGKRGKVKDGRPESEGPGSFGPSRGNKPGSFGSKKKRKPFGNKGRTLLRKSALSKWDTDAHVLNTIERKAPTHGR